MSQNFERNLLLLKEKLLQNTTNESKELILAKSKYSSAITDYITSLSELEIYMLLNLKEMYITRPALICVIDPLIKDRKGTSNIVRMLAGDPPVDAFGTPCHLHHIGQSYDGPFAELFFESHNSKKNYSILHIHSEDESWRKDQEKANQFSNEKRRYWRIRGKAIIEKKKSI